MSTAQAIETETIFEPGTAVEHYKVLRLIGRGGMGEVYLARDTRLGRKVALKVVRTQAMSTPDARERFLFEAQTTAQFNHPHIVQIYDVGEHGGRPYVALEHLEGQSLKERLDAERLGPGEALRTARAIAEALEEAHKHQIVHRDLKPGNVLLAEDGRLRVLDFGLARGLSSPRVALDETIAADGLDAATDAPTFESDGGGLRGTPAYMAPEQWRQETVGPPADIWALGIILCELVYGLHPYRGNELLALRDQVVSPDPVPLPGGTQDAPAALLTLIHDCTLKDPNARPTAESVAERLGGMMQADRRTRSRTESPFRGLLPFDERHGDQFFGRDDEIAAFVERLRSEPVLPVVGPSGAGKSSFVQAGVLPRLREQGRWLVLRLRPGAQPLRNLALRFTRGDSTLQITGYRSSTSAGRSQTGSGSGSGIIARPVTPVSGADSDLGTDATIGLADSDLGTDATIGLADSGLGTDATVAAGSADELVSAQTVLPGGAAPLPDETAPPAPEDAPTDDAPQVAELTDPDELEASLRESPGRLALLLGALAEREQARVLLLVDQLEELYTLVEDEHERTAFMESVCTASDDPESLVRVVFTLRDDFLGRLAEGQAARKALSRVTVLRSPGPEALREILIRPLEAVGYSYEDDDLVEEMVAEVRGEAAALPLLQFAGQELWEQRDRKRQLLTRATYQAVGGVAGALAHHADGVLDGLSTGQVDAARQLLVRLVTSQGTRQVISRADLLDGLGAGAAEVLDRLIEARTVLSRKSRAGEVTETVCELVHESLIQGWDRLRRWVEESREERAFLADAGQAATLWVKRGRRDEEVWQGDALREAVRALERCSGGVPESVREFIATGEQKRRSRMWRRRALLASVVAVLALIAVVLAFQNREVKKQRNQARTAQRQAEEQHQRAERSLAQARRNWAEALREGAGAALTRGNQLEARARLRASLELQDSPLARTLWLRLRRQPIYWMREAVEGSCPVLFSPDGKTLITCAENNKAIYLFSVDTRRVRRILRGPKGLMSTLAYAPDGRTVAAGTRSGTVWLWSLADGTTAKLKGHSEIVVGLDFSPDSKRLASGSRDRTARLWNVETHTVERVLSGHKDTVMGVRFHPQGKLLATTTSIGDMAVRTWDVASGRLRHKLEGHKSAVQSVAFSPDGRWLATGSYDRTIRLWDPATGKPVKVLEGHSAAILSLAFQRGGKLMASGGNGDNARLWDTQTWKQRRVLDGHNGALRGVAFHPQRPLLATKTTSKLRVWDLTVGEAPAAELGAEKDRFYAGVLSHDFRRLVFTSNRELRIRDLTTGKDRRVVTGHTDLLISLSLSRDGKLMVSGGNDNTLRLYDAATGALRRILVGAQPYGLSIDRQARHLITYSVAAHSAELWSLAATHRAHRLEGHRGPIRAFAFSWDGARVATGSFDREIRLWSTRDGRLQRVLKGHRSMVYDLVFVPDGRTLISAGRDRRILLWDVATGRLVRELGQHTSGVLQLALSEDGRTLISRCRHAVRIWDPTTGKGRLLGKVSGVTRFLDVSVHPTGEAVAGTLNDGTVRVWRPREGLERTLRGHSTSVVSSMFREDGKQLATVAQDGTAWLWDVATLRPLWQAPLFRPASQELYSHRGWLRLGPGGRKAPPPKRSRWRTAIEQGARRAHETADGALICLRTHDDRLQLWDTRADKRLFEQRLPGVVSVRAFARGCLARVRKGPALRLDAQGKSHRLVDKAQAIGISATELLVAAEGKVRIFGLDGAERTSLQVDGQVTALATDGDVVLVGRVGGSMAVYPRAAGAGTTRPIFEDVPSSPVTRLLAGPHDTVVAGFANGYVGLWSRRTGRRLYRISLHGPVLHLGLANGRLYAATALGEHRTLAVPVFYQSYCDLLREVWKQVPVAWLGGVPELRPPPASHRCRARR